jgi:hypothetical protein
VKQLTLVHHYGVRAKVSRNTYPSFIDPTSVFVTVCVASIASILRRSVPHPLKNPKATTQRTSNKSPHLDLVVASAHLTHF